MSARRQFSTPAGAASRALRTFRRPEWMVFLPAATLGAFWLGGEGWLMAVALGAPLLFALSGAFREGEGPGITPLPDGLTGLAVRPQLALHCDRILGEAAVTGRNTLCLVLLFDDAARFREINGRAALAEITQRSAERLCAALREGDLVARLDGGGFAVALAPGRRHDLEVAVQLAARLQAALAPPMSVNGMRVYVTCSVGFCLGARSPEPTGKALIGAAQIAAEAALRHGPGAIRAWQPEMAAQVADRDALREEMDLALNEGQFRAYFQPQVSTETGAVTGFEALARWHHPTRGVLPPADFLPLVEEMGLADRLGEVILFAALTALKRWDKAGHRVGSVAINFSKSELSDPRLAERLKWELDRFDLSPDRLTVEILETVVAVTDNDVIVRNVAALSRMGCGIDLDDFGTGHASITSIRRFAVRRIKIDRSFVTHLDEDPAQQKMVAAILSMAEQLDLQTLAEGVETQGEHSVLAQLGCGHVQGFGIARPMPVEETLDWIETHRASKGAVPKIGTKAR